MPRCFQCKHPVEDFWTEAFWSEAEDRYIPWCAGCQSSHDNIVRCLERIIRRCFESAIDRIPKKRKPVAS